VRTKPDNLSVCQSVLYVWLSIWTFTHGTFVFSWQVFVIVVWLWKDFVEHNDAADSKRSRLHTAWCRYLSHWHCTGQSVGWSVCTSDAVVTFDVLLSLCSINSNNSVTVVPALLLFVPCQYHALKEVITDVLCCVLHGAKQYLFSPRVILAPSSCELVCLRQWLIIAQCLPCVRYGPARIGPSGPVPSWSEVVKGMPDQGLDCFVSQGRFFCVCVWCFWCM